MPARLDRGIGAALHRGLAIPACPLALDSHRKLDERRQRALIRYYFAAGAGGLAVGVHTTQFAIRDPKIALYKPVLQLVAEELKKTQSKGQNNQRFTPLSIAGICGNTSQAAAEALVAHESGYEAGLLSLG